jgi:hypothetical protein
VKLVDGKDATTNNQYANQYIYPLIAHTTPGFAFDAFDWEFDADGDFVTSPAFYAVTTTGNVLNLQADLPGFESGMPYYVRVRGRRTGSNPLVGPWSGNNSTNRRVHRFYNALHPTALVSTDDPDEALSLNVTTGNMKLVAPHVRNATMMVFQVDDDPNFSSPFALPFIADGIGRFWLNTTHPGVEGNVFKANSSWFSIGGKNNPVGEFTHWLVEHLYGYASGTYYVRVRAANENQTGYWSTVNTINVSLPARVNKFMLAFGSLVEIPNNFADMPINVWYPGVTDDPNYIETSYDLQISADNFVTTIYSVQNVYHRGILPTGKSEDAITFKPSTTYQARVRTYINGSYPSNPSEWTYTTFTTRSATARVGADEEVQGAETNKQVTVAPNPFNHTTRLTIAHSSQKVVIRVSDMMGRMIEEINATGGETLTLGSQWQKGMYIVQVIDRDGEKQLKTFKVLKQ